MSAFGNRHDRCFPTRYRPHVCVLFAGFVAGLPGCGPDPVHGPLDGVLHGAAPDAALSPEIESRVEAFCGDCHALPLPQSLSRDRWHFGVRKGYEFYAKSGRNDLSPPPLVETLAYYRARAPERLNMPEGTEAPGAPPVTFRQETLSIETVEGVPPEVSHLQWVRLAPDEAPVLLVCDMRYGHVLAVSLTPERRQAPRVLGRLRNPAHAEVCDLDGDGTLDLVLADLGSYLPADHDRGRVVLLRGRAEGDAYEETELATGLGRVADVRPADVDGDGRLDLIVAEFGWHDTGGIHLLKNASPAGAPLQFDRLQIDDRPGTIHVPVQDFTGDGRPDFAALVSQEYESVDVFVNRGEAGFVRTSLWAAPDLTFGSSGLDLSDLNGDGRIDILFTNGDAFDDSWASPWHGVQWLENTGGPEFVYHRLTGMPGAYRALSGDFDRDGDQDIVAVAWLPPDVQPDLLRETAAIVFLEQTAPGVFARHTLEAGAARYATVAIGDFDDNGGLDFAVASGPRIADAVTKSPDLTVWWNETLPAER
jgi:hypothetical protein